MIRANRVLLFISILSFLLVTGCVTSDGQGGSLKGIAALVYNEFLTVDPLKVSQDLENGVYRISASSLPELYIQSEVRDGRLIMDVRSLAREHRDIDPSNIHSRHLIDFNPELSRLRIRDHEKTLRLLTPIFEEMGIEPVLVISEEYPKFPQSGFPGGALVIYFDDYGSNLWIQNWIEIEEYSGPGGYETVLDDFQGIIQFTYCGDFHRAPADFFNSRKGVSAEPEVLAAWEESYRGYQNVQQELFDEVIRMNEQRRRIKKEKRQEMLKMVLDQSFATMDHILDVKIELDRATWALWNTAMTASHTSFENQKASDAAAAAQEVRDSAPPLAPTVPEDADTRTEEDPAQPEEKTFPRIDRKGTGSLIKLVDREEDFSPDFEVETTISAPQEGVASLSVRIWNQSLAGELQLMGYAKWTAAEGYPEELPPGRDIIVELENADNRIYIVIDGSSAIGSAGAGYGMQFASSPRRMIARSVSGTSYTFFSTEECETIFEDMHYTRYRITDAWITW